MTKPWSPLSEANESFTADDIATPFDELLCWSPGSPLAPMLDQARKLNYSYLPVLEAGEIGGVLEVAAADAAAPTWEPLALTWLVADNTPILDLIDRFAARPDHVCFTLDGSRVRGLVSPADLNKTAARAAVYVLLAEFESSLADLIRRALPEPASYEVYLTEERLQKLHEESAQARRSDLDLDPLNSLYITDLVTIAARDKRMQQLLGFASRAVADEAMSVSYVRNLIGHPVGKLVDSVEGLQKVNAGCKRLIDLHERIERARAELSK